MRNGYDIDTLTSVDIQNIVKLVEKRLKIMKVLIIEKTLKHHRLEKL